MRVDSVEVPDPFGELTPPYSTIVADPPWPYAIRSGVYDPIPKGRVKDGSRLQRSVRDMGYSTLDMDELCSLPVCSLAANNAHLYLWTTNSFMDEAHDLARAWGFRPKTILTWVKVHQDDPSRVSMKTGYYFRGATEHALFCVRGSLRLQTAEGMPTGYLWPRIGEHSRKPEAFGDLVEKASPGPYVELFCRRPRLGWDSWGFGYEREDAV